ncbi:hypothetical protein [Tengunoibacter tsumagoiensis]|uniref:Uncharacterized protein n=1 Tax=Tengunoibacter tsumagoiensis TaxID=2014871 RepID=A0A401ZZ39_9CHLR|nr:hypothetical protein [Tengunoibacter tsumagoiensis]GCE12119.1 hypothetical protein KTT_19780 [Tengunoibacter tsumagoiensis]
MPQNESLDQEQWDAGTARYAYQFISYVRHVQASYSWPQPPTVVQIAGFIWSLYHIVSGGLSYADCLQMVQASFQHLQASPTTELIPLAVLYEAGFPPLDVYREENQ